MLQGHDNKDFYDTNLVDGYDVPISIVPQGMHVWVQRDRLPGRCQSALPARAAG